MGNHNIDALSEKQQRFVEEYLISGNAYGAAIKAGYAPATAQSSSSTWVNPDRCPANYRKVYNAIQAARAARAKRMEVTADQVVKELARVAFGDPREVASWGPKGLVFKPSEELSDDAVALVAEVSVLDGKYGTSYSYKKNDKIKALELLGKHLGMFREGIGNDEVPMPVAVNINVVDGRKQDE